MNRMEIIAAMMMIEEAASLRLSYLMDSGKKYKMSDMDTHFDQIYAILVKVNK